MEPTLARRSYKSTLEASDGWSIYDSSYLVNIESIQQNVINRVLCIFFGHQSYTTKGVILGGIFSKLLDLHKKIYKIL